MSEAVCLACGLPIYDAGEAGVRHYRVVRTGLVFSRWQHEGCHQEYLRTKPGISVSEDPPAPVVSVPAGIPGMAVPVPLPDPGAFSFSTGPEGMVLEKDGRRIVGARSDLRNTVFRKFMTTRKEPFRLGDQIRARMLREKSMERDRR